jgi:hypothetical protein
VANATPKSLPGLALRHQGGIARHILNVAMPEVGLDRPRIVTFVGELVAAGAAEHVGVGLNAQDGLANGGARASPAR